MSEKQQKSREGRLIHSGNGNRPERAGNVGPLRSQGLTEMQMLNKAIKTKPKKTREIPSN